MTASSGTVPTYKSTVLVGEDVDGRHGGDETGDIADVIEGDNTKRSR